MCAGRVFHATDALKKKEVVCLVVRAAGRISCLGFLWDRGLTGGQSFQAVEDYDSVRVCVRGMLVDTRSRQDLS